MRKKNGAIHRFNDWLIGEPLPEEYYPSVDKFGNGSEEYQVRCIAEFFLVLSIVVTALYFGLGNYLAETPEPIWWINTVEPWLKEVMLLK